MEILARALPTDPDTYTEDMPIGMIAALRQAWEAGITRVSVVQIDSEDGVEIYLLPEEEPEEDPADQQEPSMGAIEALIMQIVERLGIGKGSGYAKATDTFAPPQAVQDAAQRALGWIADGKAGSGFTDVGRARASQLARGDAVSADTIRRMNSYFARHEIDQQASGFSAGEDGYPSAGRVAWDAWGGDAGQVWASRISGSLDKAQPGGPIVKDDSPTLSVAKADTAQRYTLGPMYVPDMLDAHGEWTDAESLQSAVWGYVRSGDRRIRLQHNRDVVAGEWVECMAWPWEVTVPMLQDGDTVEMTYPANTVFLGVVWEPWAWELVKAGRLRGYSIGGTAERIMADMPDTSGGAAA